MIIYIPDESYHLPPWLQDLMTCACFVNNFSIQSSSISAMLDLIILTQSVQSASDSSEGSKLYCEGMVSVLILPALPPVHLKFIDEKTCFYKVKYCSMKTFCYTASLKTLKTVCFFCGLNPCKPPC